MSDLPANWPKAWATTVWNVGGIQVLEHDLVKAYQEIEVGRVPKFTTDRVRDRVLALLKRPGFIRYSGGQGKWVLNK